MRVENVCHVLVIEDEPLIAMLIEDILEEAGATSFCFSATEDDAVMLARERTPAIITSDVRLLEGSGPRAIERIREQVGDVPVIFLTATPEECGSCDLGHVILRKPVSHGQLMRAFRELAPPHV